MCTDKFTQIDRKVLNVCGLIISFRVKILDLPSGESIDTLMLSSVSQQARNLSRTEIVRKEQRGCRLKKSWNKRAEGL